MEPSGAVSLVEAIRKQLGLRLEKCKRMLPAIVIDHMELAPTENCKALCGGIESADIS
jgi:uncharacterized protein (TIGR03435 family)